MDHIPPELLLDIFRRSVAANCSQTKDLSLECKPFDQVALRNRDCRSLLLSSRQTKFGLILVCKKWKQIAMEIVYECILVGRNTEQLIQALAANDNENGKWVRHIEIMHEIDYEPFNPLLAFRVLHCCPLVEIITKPYLSESGGPKLSTLRISPGMEFPELHKLRRIDWWITCVGPDRRCGRDNLGFLDQIVAHAPNLNYVTLSGGHSHFCAHSTTVCRPFNTHKSYPSVTTLRFELERHETVSYPPKSLLPNLTHLIIGLVNHSAAGDLLFLQKHGPLIRTLSFINVDIPNYHGFLMVNTQDPEIPHKIFASCPNITELHATLRMGTLFNTKAIYDDANATPVVLRNVLFGNLKCIRIGLDDTSVMPSANFALFIIHNHTSHFPALERIVLHGDIENWKGLMCYMILWKYMVTNMSILLEFA